MRPREAAERKGLTLPKENINYDRNEPETLAPEFSLHWSGGPAGVVQLGVEFDIKVMQDLLSMLAKNSPTDKRTSIYSIGLERDEVQRMIRAGKRARDAVFGADE